MTREEAIHFAECLKHNWTIDFNDMEEFCDMAIEALQDDMYCPNCRARLVPEDKYLEPTQTHGRLIDADALMRSAVEKFYITNYFYHISEMIENAPTVQADRPHGEWLYRWNDVECSECGEFEKHKSNFCPNCGADMRGGGADGKTKNTV